MSSVSDTIRAKLEELINQYVEIAKHIGKDKEFLDFGFSYQIWYTRALSIIASIAPDRLEEFKGHYLNTKRKDLNALTYTLHDYLQGIAPKTVDAFGNPPYDPNRIARIRFLNQYQILGSLVARLDSVLSDVKGHLFAELQDAELAAASKLLKTSHRAAGALAGVVLERHLQRVAENHAIPIKKREPTIADLNDPLKASGVYDVALWRKIQLLADLRNLCSHQKSREPTQEEVVELISGVNNVVKTVF